MTDSGTFGDSVYEHAEAAKGAENLDPVENLTGDDPDEIMQTGYSPPDREPHSLRDPQTDFDELHGRSLDERLADERPDAGEAADSEADPRAGRLVVSDEGEARSDEAEQVAQDVGPAGYASSAEEAAVHVRPEER